MSGTLHLPLIAPQQASQLLDEVVYERVLRCIDLRALFMVEVDLWVALSECEVADDDTAKQMAKQMIDQALSRLPREQRRYAPMQPFGFECPDCEEEMLDTAKRKRGTKG